MTIRVGLIGASHWHAERHVAALLDYGAEIVGAADSDPAVAQRVAVRAGAKAFVDYRDMLDRLELDFVLSMPPHDQAAAAAVHIIQRRLPAIVEKPAGLRASEVARLATMAREARLHIAVPFVNRYSTLVGRVDRWSDPPVHGAFRIVNGPPTRYAAAGCAWMLDAVRSGGGALRNLGIHAADAALTLLAGGNEDYSVHGCKLIFQEGLTIEVHGQATVTFANGSTALIEAGYTYPLVTAGMTRGGDYEWRLATRNAYRVESSDVVRVADASGEVERPTIPSAERYRRFVHDTLNRWQAGERPKADLDDCRRAAELIDRIYDAAGAPWVAAPATVHAHDSGLGVDI
jgi:predicted dehydrogenase